MGNGIGGGDKHFGNTITMNDANLRILTANMGKKKISLRRKLVLGKI